MSQLCVTRVRSLKFRRFPLKPYTELFSVGDRSQNPPPSMAMGDHPVQSPPRMSAHTVTRHAGYLYLIGGRCKESVGDIKIGIWRLKPGDDSESSWEKVETDGKGPGQRWGHTACSVDERRLFVFGGFDHQTNYGDGFFLDTSKTPPKWSTAQFKGDTVHYRAYHSTVTYNNTVVMFGGCYCECGSYAHFNDVNILSLDTMHWKKLEVKSSPHKPTPRSQHSALLMGRKMVVVGGYDCKSIFNDVFVLDIEQKKWTHIPVYADGHKLPSGVGLRPRPFRIFPARRPAVARGSKIYVVGNIKRFQNEPLRVHLLDLKSKIAPETLSEKEIRDIDSPVLSSINLSQISGPKFVPKKRRSGRPRASPPHPPLAKTLSRTSSFGDEENKEDIMILRWERVHLSMPDGSEGHEENKVVTCSPDNHAVVIVGGELVVVHSGQDSCDKMCISRLTLTKNKPRQSLWKDMSLLFKFITNLNPNTPESSLACLEAKGKRFYVHKGLLSMTSDYFKTMWTTRMKEYHSNLEPVKMGGISDLSAFRAMLRFMYTSDLDYARESSENLLNLLTLSDQYDIPSLRNACECLAASQISKHNIKEWVRVSSRLHLQILATECANFLSTLSRKRSTSIIRSADLDHEERREVDKAISKMRKRQHTPNKMDAKRPRLQRRASSGQDTHVTPPSCLPSNIVKNSKKALMSRLRAVQNDQDFNDFEIFIQSKGTIREEKSRFSRFTGHEWLLEARGCTGICDKTCKIQSLEERKRKGGYRRPKRRQSLTGLPPLELGLSAYDVKKKVSNQRRTYFRFCRCNVKNEITPPKHTCLSASSDPKSPKSLLPNTTLVAEGGTTATCPVDVATKTTCPPAHHGKNPKSLDFDLDSVKSPKFRGLDSEKSTEIRPGLGGLDEEKGKGEMKRMIFQNVKEESMQAFLSYIYTAKIPSKYPPHCCGQSEYLYEILAIAEEFGVEGKLYGQIERYLCTCVEVSNVVQMLKISQDLDMPNLEDICTDTIASARHRWPLSGANLRGELSEKLFEKINKLELRLL